VKLRVQNLQKRIEASAQESVPPPAPAEPAPPPAAQPTEPAPAPRRGVRAQTLALTSTILTGLAVVGAGVGALLFVTAGPADEAPARQRGPNLAFGADGNGARASAIC